MKKNKVLIINPPSAMKVVREGRCEQRTDSYQYVMVPISLPSIAAVLREKGIDVKVYDSIADNLSLEDVKKILIKENPALAIINIATLTFKTDIETAKICKELKIPSAAIGIHATTLPEYSLKNSDFDFAIRGEPEIISLNLAKAIINKKPLKSIRGISFKKGKKIINNRDEKLIENLDRLPFPARDLVHNEKYTAPITHKPYTLIITARGCPFNCIFCTAKKYYGQKQRIRSPENILREIKEIVNKYKIYDIGMWSDTFTFNRQQVIGIANGIIKERIKINWFCNSRVDTIDEEMIKLMAESGCKVITFGVESLDENILKDIRKNISLKQVKIAVDLCRKYKIESQLHLIFGLPGETRETMEKTIKEVIKLDPDYAQFYCAVPFPGTDFRDYVIEKGYLKNVDWAGYEINKAIVSYPNLSSEEIQNARKKAYRKFYFRPEYVLKKMKSFPVREWKKIATQTYHFFRGWVWAD